MSETVASIVAAHRAGAVTPEQTVARSYERIRAHGDDAIFISLRPEADVLADGEVVGKFASTGIRVNFDPKAYIAERGKSDE